MSGLGVFLVLLLCVGAMCVVIALSQLWAVGGGIDDPVGARRPRRPAPPPPAIAPSDLRSLIHNESTNWKRPEQWNNLTEHLDHLERELGGQPAQGHAPDEFSAEWLDARLQHLEALAGPLPAPIRRSEPAIARRVLWRRS